MSLEANARLGRGGNGFQGGKERAGSAAAMIQELQGLTVSVLGASGAGAKNNLAAIRKEDTLVAVLNNAGGTLADVMSTTTISETHATGTITVGTNMVADETVTVNGVIYTAKAAPDPLDARQFALTATTTTCAAALAAAINAYEKRVGNHAQQVIATPSTNTVGLYAVADGTEGNAYTLTSQTGKVTVTGSGTMTGGTATGGIAVTGGVTIAIVIWFNKRP